MHTSKQVLDYYYFHSRGEVTENNQSKVVHTLPPRALFFSVIYADFMQALTYTAPISLGRSKWAYYRLGFPLERFVVEKKKNLGGSMKAPLPLPSPSPPPPLPKHPPTDFRLQGPSIDASAKRGKRGNSSVLSPRCCRRSHGLSAMLTTARNNGEPHPILNIVPGEQFQSDFSIYCGST